MKKKVTFLIGLLLLIFVVWGITYFGLKHDNLEDNNKTTSGFSI